MMNAHIQMVEAVNDATTEREHERAEARLEGFRLGLEAAGVKPNLLGCDMHYLNQGIDRLMCCGVFLDWKPK